MQRCTIRLPGTLLLNSQVNYVMEEEYITRIKLSIKEVK
jgi:hypothetical protein